MSKVKTIAFGLLVLTAGVACGLSSQVGTPQAESDGSPPPEVPIFPVSVNEGLASLDSYRMTYTTDVFDSVAGERTISTFVVASDRATDASYSRSETQVMGGENEAVSDGVDEQFVIGSQMCSLSDGEAEMTPLSQTAQVMADLMSQVVEFNPLIENPVYVGDEVVNGVPARTYSFELRSVGAASELEATRADGSYAIAADGDYLLQYNLDLELRSAPEGDPEAESSVFSIELSLENVNQPVEILFPPECQVGESSGG